MSDLTEFLLARIAEDEAVATLGPRLLQTLAAGSPDHSLQEVAGREDARLRARVLAECKAKRHLLDEALVWGEGCLDVVARYMAEVYADHPAYRPAYRP